MMGVKLRAFAPLGGRSLEELVPADSIYRRLQRVLDLSFVYDLVADCYSSAVEANASLDSVIPRFAVEAHLHRLFAAERPVLADETQPPSPEGCSLPDNPASTPADHDRHDWIAMVGRPQRAVRRWGYERKADWQASRTDPDASVMPTRGGSHLGYHTQYVVDGGTARIILAALVTPSEVMENMPMRDLIWHTVFRWKVWPRHVTGDTTYGTADNIVALEQAGIRAYMPLPDFDRRTPYLGKSAFVYDAAHDVYVCPQGALLRRSKLRRTQGLIEYRADGHVCNACAVKAACTESDHGRSIHHSLHEAYLDRVRGYHATEAYAKAMRKRQVWIEPLFGEAKQWHGLRRFRLRGLEKVNSEALLTAAGQNVKRLLQAVRGRMRPWPSGGQALPVGAGYVGHIAFSQLRYELDVSAARGMVRCLLR